MNPERFMGSKQRLDLFAPYGTRQAEQRCSFDRQF